MTRLQLMSIMVVVCAVGVGCSSPAVTSASSEVGDEPPMGPQGAGVDAEGTQLSSDALPPYEPVAGLSGKITSIGASTTTNLVARVTAEFRRMYPNVEMKITASLTRIGPSALIENRADIVPMSRPLAPEEVRAFVAEYGYPPTEIRVAADALAIYVEKRNPLVGLMLDQLDGVFSRTQHSGRNWIETWGQLGLTGEWTERPITLYGYSPEDGAHEIFQQRVLHGEPLRMSVRLEGSGSSIVQGIAADPKAIGYASIFFACKRVRAVPVAGIDGHFYEPTAENVHEHRYPLSRFLYICVNKPPRRTLSGPAAEFLRFVLSREGQQIVADGGNFPLDAASVARGRRALEE